ncbi:MAG: hypothetical protein QOG83_3397 [Alphaproteobacteria bacterium]|nr:hypothetical protein [Alphaproteobacteria bacterium]
MSSEKGIREVGWFDCAGGGQIVVDKGIAYVGHMAAPHGTSIVDVRDPKNPKGLASLEMPTGTHSHKARVSGGIMVVNHEAFPPQGAPPAGWRGGFGVYDVSEPSKPRPITRWETSGSGCHRYDLDGHLLFTSATLDGYHGTIMMIFDLKDPAKPQEVGRWWMPGQWTAGGETPTWKGFAHRCHHPLRHGDRLYVSYWQGGFVILDIADMSKPKFVAGLDWSPPFPSPTHSAVPVPFEINGRKILMVADEDVMPLFPGPPAFLWMVDITVEERPVPFATFQIDALDGSPQPTMTGCHQPVEKVTGTEIPAAWFANGLRVIDISRPRAPREVAHFMPDPPPESKRLSSNDVFVDERGLIYLLDRVRGFHILERV